MAKQYIDVLIDGKVYSLGGSETEGYVQQIATYLFFILYIPTNQDTSFLTLSVHLQEYDLLLSLNLL